MRGFCAFQIVAYFAGAPFLICWLAEATFKFHDAAFWGAIVAYIVGFCFMCHTVAEGIKDASWK